MRFAWHDRPIVGTAKVKALAANRDVPALIQLASQESGGVRAAAASQLYEMDADETAPAVTDALRDRSDRVRCAAIDLLCHRGDALALAQAVWWLPRQGASRFRALAAIAQLRQPKSAPVLAGSLVAGPAEDNLWEDEVQLVLSLCESTGNPAVFRGVLNVLTQAFEVEQEHISRRAEDFLVWLGEDAVAAVAPLVRSSAASHRAVWVLGQIGGPSTLEPLIDAVDHPDARARAAACVALGALGDPITVEALIRAMKDPEHQVRVEAAAALERIGIGALLVGFAAALTPQLEPAKPHPRLAHAPENGSAAERRVAGAQQALGH
jgi:HEAT repeat protein